MGAPLQPRRWRARPLCEHARAQVRYTRSKDNATIYATALTGFGSAPTGGQLPLADVVPAPGSQVFLLGYEDEGSRTPLPVAWSQQGGHAVLTVPADLAAHPAVLAPAMVFVIKGQPA
jgi:hypothetical protein